MSEPKKRLFVAIALPEALQRKLEEVQTQLKRFARDAKWAKVAGIHLTLKFLGYVEPAKIQGITASLSSIASHHGAAFVSVKGCGFFPNELRPRVLWAGIAADSLPALQRETEAAMAALGFETENREFHPHLTLARFKDSRGLLPLTQEAKNYSDAVWGEFTADHFSLYESILHPQGAEYRKLEIFKLQ